MAKDKRKSYPYQVAIDEYGDLGFRFAHLSHKGSVLCLPSGMYAWDIKSPSELSLELLAPILAESENIDFLYIGMGKDIAPLKAEIRQAFAERNIGVEAIATGAAISTYNILLDEKRPVAAAFIAISH